MAATLSSSDHSHAQAVWRNAAARHWPLFAGFLVLLLPTIVSLGKEVWSMEIGAHGPIVLATGLWLVTQRLDDMRAKAAAPSSLAIVLILLLSLPVYIFGRAYDFISLEAAGTYGAMIALVYMLVGWRALRDNIFPFLYLGFLVPPPGWLIDQLTAPLRHLVSAAAMGVLEPFSYPIVREGVTLFIGSYQLLVEDACAGMNSSVGLTAITLKPAYRIGLRPRRSTKPIAMNVASMLVRPTAAVNHICAVVA